MSDKPGPAHIPKALQARIDKLNFVEQNGLRIVKDFGVFIDTHRDQPHVGSFHEDVHRGMCAPMMVDYVIDDDYLRNPEDGKLLQRHHKHLFLEPEAWGAWLLEQLMTKGDPRDGDGLLPTSHFRDPRKGIYMLKSFRQIVDYQESKK